MTTYLQGSLVQHPRRNVKCAFNPDSSQGGFAGANTLITVNPQKLTCPNCLQKFTRFFSPLTETFKQTEMIQQVENEKQIDWTSRH